MPQYIRSILSFYSKDDIMKLIKRKNNLSHSKTLHNKAIRGIRKNLKYNILDEDDLISVTKNTLFPIK